MPDAGGPGQSGDERVLHPLLRLLYSNKWMASQADEHIAVQRAAEPQIKRRRSA
ncbi:MAG: hypothetical protein VX293_07260 [Candidatus Latescibacterota bacterium]|nr:hypothetical protein [Candidatus Latescibacterota bacterium]